MHFVCVFSAYSLNDLLDSGHFVYWISQGTRVKSELAFMPVHITNITGASQRHALLPSPTKRGKAVVWITGK